jgi:NADPH-dependent curcumin reductase CurA
VTELSRYIALKEYIPLGKPNISQFELKEKKISLDNDGDVMIQNQWVSVDPYMRARMTERKNYKPPFEIGKPMEGSCIGHVIDSKSKELQKGDIVLSEYGWRDKFVTNYTNLKKINPINVPNQTYLGPLGFTGHTAYIGLFRIGELKKNQTVFESFKTFSLYVYKDMVISDNDNSSSISK